MSKIGIDATASPSLKKHLFLWLLTLLLCAYYILLAVEPIRFTTQDIGRHIKNGEVIVNNLGDLSTIKKLLTTNFYSFAYPDHPFVNHHWLSGVFFYLVSILGGFGGVSILYYLLCLASMLIFFRIAIKEGGLWSAFAAALLAMPLIAARREIRPEGFGYIFFALFIWIVSAWERGKISRHWLWLLPAITAIWVNCHISFIFGILFLALVCIEKLVSIKGINGKKRSRSTAHDEAIVRRFQLKTLGITFAAAVCAACINPFFVRGLLFPFLIFKEYGHKLIENQSVRFLTKRGLVQADFLDFKFVIAILGAFLLLLLITNRKKISLRWLLLSIILGAMALFAIRHFTFFGLVAIAVLTHAISALHREKGFLLTRSFLILICLVLAATWMLTYSRYLTARMQQGIHFGLPQEQNIPAKFIKEHHIHGPYFNNYDIGSYLIYHVCPEEKVFVDNRPEAYPAPFFQNDYIPMQENNEDWQRMIDRYKFQAIVFQYNDVTRYAHAFLTSRINDPAWIPVFAQHEVIVFVPPIPEYAELIKKYEIPREYFSRMPER